MSGHIPEDKIREVLERADIQEVVSSYVTLRRSGANWQGLCPFHAEKTPSFNVNPPRQFYHCFGCGVGGDVISFVQRIEGLSFPEAVRRLAERYGIEITEEAPTPEQDFARRRNEQLLRINQVAAEFYHGILMDDEDSRGRPAREYLKRRGYGRETAERFLLGYAPQGWEALTSHLAQKGFDAELVRQLGLIRPGKQGRGDYDLFRQRLIFPIHSARGDVAAFGARVLDQSLPKYINSPESPVYHKSAVLYGYHQAREAMRRADEAIVVEGYFDVLALHRVGMTQAVATCGTALTAEHARLLKRFATRVVLLFDQDDAGRKATFRAMEALLPEGLTVVSAVLPEGDDPDSLLVREGVRAFRARIDAARPVFDLFIDERLALRGDSVQGRARAAEDVVARLGSIPSEIERDLYIQELAQKTGVDLQLLKQMAGRAGAHKEERSLETRSEPPRLSVPPPTAVPPRFSRSNSERSSSVAGSGRTRGAAAPQALLRYLLESEEVRRRAREEGIENLLVEPSTRQVAHKILDFAVSPGPVSRAELAEKLDADEARLLEDIRLPAHEVFGEDLDALFAECRAGVRRGGQKRQRTELMQRIHDAEKKGDNEALARLTLELRELRRGNNGKIE
jgi:DNA primase